MSEDAVTRQELLVRAAGGAAGLAALGGVIASPARASVAKVTRARATPRKIARIAIGAADLKEGLDPALSIQTNDVTYMSQIYEGLVETGVDFVPRPLLAESWTSNANATKWTIRLRQGVKFHDGSPLTARDVAWSLRRLVDKNVGSGIYSRLVGSLVPDGIKVVNNRTLSITLRRPDSGLIVTLGQRYAAIVKNGTRNFNLQTAIGTGPFKIKSLKPGESWELERHAQYWQSGNPRLAGLEGIVIPEQATKVQSVLSGRSDLADSIDFSAAASVRGNAALLPIANGAYLVGEMDVTHPLFQDNRVRQAIKLAIDRKAMVGTALAGYGARAGDMPVARNDIFYPPSVGNREQNIQRARALLAQAGHRDGIELDLVTSNAVGGMVDFAVSLAAIVADAGIKVNVDQRPPQTYFTEVARKVPFWVTFSFRRYGPDALTYYYTSDAPFPNTHMKSARLDKLVRQGLAIADPKSQRDVFRHAMALVANTGGSLIPAFEHLLWARQVRLRNVQLDASKGVLLRRAYLS